MRVGRNEPCPCGSGRKYKHCCMGNDQAAGPAGDDEILRAMLGQTGFSSMKELDAAMQKYGRYCESLPDDQQPPSFMEFLGKRSPASGLLSQLHDLASSLEFASKEELEAEFQRTTTASNARPLDDFEGLSSDDIHTLLYKPAESEIFAINGAVTDTAAVEAPIVQQISWALAYLIDQRGEVKLTQRENFNRKMCESYLTVFAGWWKPGDPIPTEQTLPDLFVLHEILLSTTYVDSSPTRMWITPEGLDVMREKQWSKVFIDALLAALGEFDWQSWFPPDRRHDHMRIIQQSAVFSLYLLKRRPTGTTEQLFDRFIRAFPAFIEPAGSHEKRLDFFREFYLILFAHHFGEQFGLVELQDDTKALTDYKVTDLFRAAFVWKSRAKG